MRSVVSRVGIAVALVLAGTTCLTAQSTAQSLPRIAADDLLAGRSVAATFEALQSRLNTGREVVVTDERGRPRRGRVVTLSPSQIVLASPVSSGGWEAMLPLYWPADAVVIIKRRLFPAGHRTFDEAAVTRVDVVDPTGNGPAIGAAIGASVATGVFLWERGQPDSSLKGLLTTLAVVVGIPISARMGHVIDRANNAPVFQQSVPRARVILAPSVSHDRAAALVAVRW